jgi:hypothetical protein
MRLLGDLFFTPPSFCAQAEASLVLRSHNYFTLFLSRRHATPIPAFFRSYPARDKLWALRVTPCVMSQKKKGRKRERETHPSRCKSPMVRWSILVSSNPRAQNVVDNFSRWPFRYVILHLGNYFHHFPEFRPAAACSNYQSYIWAFFLNFYFWQEHYIVLHVIDSL